MTITRGIAAAAVLAGLAVGAASTAWAAPTMRGHYVRIETNAQLGGSSTIDWYFTPCGDGCAQLTSPRTAQAQLVNGQWAMDMTGDALCTDGKSVPNAEADHYTWDPNTLAGIVQITDKFAVCGFSAPVSYTNNVQLKEAP